MSSASLISLSRSSSEATTAPRLAAGTEKAAWVSITHAVPAAVSEDGVEARCRRPFVGTHQRNDEPRFQIKEVGLTVEDQSAVEPMDIELSHDPAELQPPIFRKRQSVLLDPGIVGVERGLVLMQPALSLLQRVQLGGPRRQFLLRRLRRPDRSSSVEREAGAEMGARHAKEIIDLSSHRKARCART